MTAIGEWTTILIFLSLVTWDIMNISKSKHVLQAYISVIKKYLQNEAREMRYFVNQLTKNQN